MAERNTRNSHEMYVGDNPPEITQLLKLASYAMVSAQATNTHRVMSTRPRTHFSVQEIDYMNEAGTFAFDGYPVEARRRMAVRIGRQTLEGMPLRAWSLKLFDTNWFGRPDGSWDGVRDLYRFEWDHNEVTLADKVSKFVTSRREGERDMYYDLEHFSVPEHAAAIVAAEYEMTQMTSADCNELLTEVGEYYQNNYLQRQYPAE